MPYSTEKMLNRLTTGAWKKKADTTCAITVLAKDEAFEAEGVSVTVTQKTVRCYAEIKTEENAFVRVEVWLPANWNGVFLGCGNGGMGGKLDRKMLNREAHLGYAVAHTDIGTSKGFEFGINNPAVWKDFGYRATHRMTELGKELAEAAYGKKPRLCLFRGGSTGGEQALTEIIRHPGEYNGVICVAPANNRVALHTYFLWNYLHLKGKFNGETAEKINALALSFNGKLPNTRVEDFVNLVTEKLSLSQEQKEALLAVYRGPVQPKTGKRIYNGLPIGTETVNMGLAYLAGAEFAPFHFIFRWALGDDYRERRFDFDKDFNKTLSLMKDFVNANETNLSPFFQAGGKLLMVAALQDPCVPYPDTWRYAEKVAAFGKGSFRFFMVPRQTHAIAVFDKEHIFGEAGENILSVLENWCETGKAPDAIRAETLDGVQPVPREKFDQMELCPETTDESLR